MTEWNVQEWWDDIMQRDEDDRPCKKAQEFMAAWLPSNDSATPADLVAATRGNSSEWHFYAEDGLIGWEFVAPIASELSNSDWRVRHNAVNALRCIGDTRAVSPLITALGDTDEIIRYSVAYALGSLGDPVAISALITVQSDDKYDATRAAATEALAKLGYTGAGDD